MPTASVAMSASAPIATRRYDVDELLAADASGTATPAPEDRAATIADETERRIAVAVARQHASTMRDELELEAIHENFDTVLKRQAESEREMNEMRDLSTEQLKRDDENLKKWMALI